MLRPPALLLLCGLPFAGKTTLAGALACRLGLRHVSLDEVNRERGIGLHGQPILPHEWEATYAEAYRRVEALLSTGQAVIYDETNFLRAQRDRLRAIAARHGAPTHVIHVDVPAAEARRRWLANRLTGARGDVRDDDFAHVVARFEPPTEAERVLRYDGTIPAEVWIDQTFGRLGERS